MTDSATRVTGALGPPSGEPSRLDRADLGLLARRTAAQFTTDDVLNLAAGVAFKIFLSIFPTLLAAAAIFSLLNAPADVQSMVDVVGRYLPPSVVSGEDAIVRTTLQDITSTEEGAAGGLALIGVTGGLFTATGAAVSLMRALNRAYSVRERRTAVRLRLIGLVLTAALFVALLTLIGLIVLGPQVRSLLIPEALDSVGVGFLFRTGQFLLAVAVLSVLFAVVYWIAPSRERRAFVWFTPGAAVGVVLMLVASFGFTLYTQTLGTYASSYGALAGVVVLLLWLQLTMLAILVGGEINAEVEALRAERRALRRAAGLETDDDRDSVDPDPGLQRAAAALVDGPPPPRPSTPMTRAVEREDPTTELPVLGLDGRPVTEPTAAPVVAATAAPTPTPAPTGAATRLGAVAGGVMAALVFLGLARRRRRSG